MVKINKENSLPLNIAHRGASSLSPENTFAAFDTALISGAKGLEFDVQLSKDIIPVIIHDESLERTTNGTGPVKELTLKELKTLDAGSWFAPNYKGTSIPTLEEVFKKYQNRLTLFNIELKNHLTEYPGLEEAVLEQIDRYQLEKRVIISSFNARSLVTCRRIKPAVRTGLIYLEEIKDPWLYIRSLGCYSAHPHFIYLQDPKILAGFKLHNIPLYPWTVNDPGQMEYLVSKKVAGIITDYPQELHRITGQAD